MSGTVLAQGLKSLSPLQLQAVEWTTGSLLVLAGPGSGKTRVLTHRIARLLASTQGETFRVLGLTFTNKAADEMRSRIVQLAPGYEERLFLGTFHSFCADILRQHGQHLGIPPSFKIYAQDEDLQAVLEDAIDAAEQQSDVVYDVDKKALPVIHRLKSSLILPDDAQGAFRDPDWGRRMAAVYSAYEAELKKREALDFDSLILKTYQLFRDYPAFAKRYRKVYPYICIDEFQDTNLAQYLLIRQLTGNEHKNLFVVADDDQIVYQWNGASYQRLEQFRADYSPEILQLPLNYRCPVEVIEVANRLISHNFMRTSGKAPLQAVKLNAGHGIVRLLPFPNSQAEATGIAQDIKHLHSNNYGTVAILARNRRLIDKVGEALSKEAIPSVIAQRKNEFESTPFVWLHSILRLANEKQSLKYLEAVCGTFFQLSAIETDPEVVVRQAAGTQVGYLQSWTRLLRSRILSPLYKDAINAISYFLGGSQDFRGFNRLILDWFAQLVAVKQAEVEPSDAEVYARYEEERRVWEELFREITSFLGEDISLDAFLQEMQMRSKESPPKPNTVILTTIHAAKGKEFCHVYLIGMAEDELPSFQSKQKGDGSPEMEEERRNCFVAITRTVETLTLSYSDEYRGYPKMPSRFLNEMGLISS